MSSCKTWLTKKILKRSVLLVSNILSEIISPFNPDQYFPIQINIFWFRSLATLNKNEFIVGAGYCCLQERSSCITLGTASAYLLTLIDACILFLADLGHYDKFCHGSYGINRIHMRSWILASTSSLDRLFLQSGELIIATTAQRKTTRSFGWTEGWTNTPCSLTEENTNWKLLQHGSFFFLQPNQHGIGTSIWVQVQVF
jgi:hypothetical protein